MDEVIRKTKGTEFGLGEILSGKAPIPNEQPEKEGITNISLECLIPDELQPRKDFDYVELSQLAESIKFNGVLQPIIVVSKGSDKYKIISGERRWRAAKIAGLKDMPCILIEADKKHSAIISLVENIQRVDLSPMEQAESLLSLNEEHHLTHQQISAVVGKPRSTITNFLRLNSLDPSVKKLINDKKLSFGHAKVLLTCREDIQVKCAHEVARKKLSVRDLEVFIKRVEKPDKSSKNEIINTLELERVMEDVLGKRVEVVCNSSSKDKVIISNKDLMNKLLEIIKMK